MYKILGLINVALMIVITSPYWLRRSNQWIFHKKSPALNMWIKKLRLVHKPFGVCLLLISLLHGYLALGALRLHTGSVVWAMILVTVLLGGSFYKTKKSVFFVWHKRSALITVILILVHLLFPNAFYYIFNL